MKYQQNVSKNLKYAVAVTALFSSLHGHAQECQAVVWQDNFDQANLNTSNWQIQTGDGCDQGVGMCGWGNEELQSYQAENLTIANGVLTIEARKERKRGTQYTSGRIRTASMPASGEWSFGRFEARMKIPDGQGMWPAFWMLPTNPSQGWPMSGEIDVFESVGQSANMSYGTIHYGQPWPDNKHQGSSILMQPGKWSDAFHTYAVEWEAGEIRWYVDNILYSTKTAADVAPEDWPFDGRNDFHLILNLAVGGTWGGNVDNGQLPQQLQVDYVKVFAGNQPNLSGNHLPRPGAVESYTVLNPGASTTWSVTGGTVSGSGETIQVTWDPSSASTVQTLTATSGGCEVSTSIYVGKALSVETVLENFDGTSNLSLSASTGVYEVSSGQLNYTRDAASQWDVIAYNTNAISDAQPFMVGDKAFAIDFNNTDPQLVGKEILIQLEDGSVATPSNFPGGRHSKFQGFIQHDNGWQTINFQLLERLDGATADTSIDSYLILIDPNSLNGDSYQMDNLNILGSGSTPANSDPIALFSVSCSGLSCSFDATGSSDPDGSIVQYNWDFGDGQVGSGVSANHTYTTAGNYVVQLTVTDDLNATANANESVSVVENTGEATFVYVSDIQTGTTSAGKGSQYGSATVTVLDELGQPVAGALVYGSFSGSWNESTSAVTDSTGIASFITSSAKKGGLQINFCVNTVEAALPVNNSSSTGMCQ